MDEYRELINYKYLRQQKAECLRKWVGFKFDGSPMECKMNLSETSYKNATILPLKRFNEDNLLFGRGGVITENGEYVVDSGIENRIEGKYEFGEQCEKSSGRVIFCGYLVNHWGHFLIEAVSRLWRCLEEKDASTEFVFYVELDSEREIQGNYKQFFELLGILDRVDVINKPCKYEEVVVPERAYKWKDSFAKEYLQMFDIIRNHAICNCEIEKYDKVFLSRRKLKNHAETDIGADILESFLCNNGYKEIFPERMPLDELIYIMENAKEIATVSGTLPHNMLFTSGQQKLTIFERNILNNEIQADINFMRKLYVTYVDVTLLIYPMGVSSGPFFFYPTKQWVQYSADRGYAIPVIDKKKLTKNIKKYRKEYLRLYSYSGYWVDWFSQFIDLFEEAFIDRQTEIGNELSESGYMIICIQKRLKILKKRISKLIKKLFK